MDRPPMNFLLEQALALLLEDLQDGPPLTPRDIRRLTVQFILDNIPDTNQDDVEDEYDRMYATGRLV
jgi:hypothetical protein